MTTVPSRKEPPTKIMIHAGLAAFVLGLVLFVIGHNGIILGPSLLLMVMGIVAAVFGFGLRLLDILEERGK